MSRALAINHVTMIVDDLEASTAFYEKELGLELMPAFKFDYPVSFFRINEHQQLHLSEWKDTPSFRGHVALQVDDWEGAFRRFRELGIIDTSPWGKVRKLPDGTYQMFVRDPAGNLVEISGAPGSTVDPAIFDDADLCDQGENIYVSNRDDDRGLKSDDASLYHGKK